MTILRSLHVSLVLTTLAGCGPAIPIEELGTIEYEVPQFDPVDQRYPLPKLGEPEPEEPNAEVPTETEK